MKTVHLVIFAVSAGCATTSARNGKERYGWFHSPVTVQDKAYAEGFDLVGSRIELVPCEQLASTWRPGHRPLYVLIHGAGGEGVEIQRTVPLLASGAPTALYRFRWTPWETRRSLVQRLSRGISHLSRCAGDREVIVIGHSAGGVLAALAGGSIDASPWDAGPAVTVVTIGAPLSGAVVSTPGIRPAAHFFFDLGRSLAYPEPAAGVRMIHLRTDLPGDVQMAPILGHPPNDPRVGAPGALTVDLPSSLTHAGALFYVSHLIAHDEFEAWLADERPRELPQRKARTARSSASRRPQSLRR